MEEIGGMEEIRGDGGDKGGIVHSAFLVFPILPTFPILPIFTTATSPFPRYDSGQSV